MSSIVSKAVTLYRNRGLLATVRHGLRLFYQKAIRSHLPKRTGEYNGVIVESARFGDRVTPWESPDNSSYESAIVDGIKKRVENGDHVVVVGGGWGVSTVTAAKMVGPDGTVRTYEAADNAVQQVKQTTELNGVTDRTTIVHGIVAKEISTMGVTTGARLVSPKEIPECDVLILDCEGAEKKIIDSMEISPRCIIVETHGHLGAPTDSVRHCLLESGYSVDSEAIAETGKQELCVKNDIYVLVSSRNIDSV